METNPTPPPGEKKPLLWPIVVNLAALVGLTVYFGGNAASIASTILALVVLNLCAALLVSRFKRLNWVIAFLQSALLLPLIGFGLCVAFIAANGGLHGGH